MKNKTVLILSDKSQTTPAWMEAFAQRGLKAISTSSPSVALQHWHAEAPMLTVMDLALPSASCLTICRQLRTISNAPILLILYNPRGEDFMEAYRAGVDECLIQPASPAVIFLKAMAWSMRIGWSAGDSAWKPNTTFPSNHASHTIS